MIFQEIDSVRLFIWTYDVWGKLNFYNGFTDNSVPAGLAYTQGFMYMAATNGTFSVDTFFVIGGLLTAYLLIKRWNKNGKADNVLLLYLHRYIR